MRLCTALLLSALLAVLPQSVLAWGALGHHLIGEEAARHYPSVIPAFLKTPTAIRQLAALASEPDISRDAGQPHDWDSDPGHFVDGSDDGTVLGGPLLSALPASRQDYDTALRAVKSTEYKAGFLPYNIIDGWQQLVKDFAIWRADVAGRKLVKTSADRKLFEQDRILREAITLRDLGVWSHYVGDASQPMHVSVHYNGWGDGPNPEGFITATGLHSKFESTFVNANITPRDVETAMRPYQACACTIQMHTQDYLTTTLSFVIPAYRLDKAGAFDVATPASKAFVAARIAEGAAQLRDLVTDAWTAAGQAQLGYTEKVSVSDLEAGKADPAPLVAPMREANKHF